MSVQKHSTAQPPGWAVRWSCELPQLAVPYRQYSSGALLLHSNVFGKVHVSSMLCYVAAYIARVCECVCTCTCVCVCASVSL